MRIRVTGLFLLVLGLSPARAATMEGVTMPDHVTVDGTELTLNGIGMRTYSLLRIRVYVAGLYLDQPSHDGAEIVHSTRPKRLEVHFLRDLTAEKGREAWSTGFADNCKEPCRLKPELVERFLSQVPSVQKGDVGTLAFSGGSVAFDLNGKVLGRVDDPLFTSVILSTFIGAAPVTQQLKQQLLGLAAH